jgi:Predicted oxidoreductases (related to aryl-alcohol dehydrogenases)
LTGSAAMELWAASDVAVGFLHDYAGIFVYGGATGQLGKTGVHFRQEVSRMKYLELFSDTAKPARVSQIALGCDHFGESVPADQVFRIMDAYYELGGNLFDTAHIYSWMETNGISESEKLLGEWMAANGVRQRSTIVTKGAHPERTAMQNSRISEKNVNEEIASSLETLRMDHVDIWFLHRDNPAMPVGEIIDMISPLVDKGQAMHLGASNWSGKRLAEANDYAKRNGRHGIEISQIQWSLARSTPEDWADPTLVCMNDDEYGYYLSSRMPVMVFSPQAHGLFSKMIAESGDALPEKFRKRFPPENNRDRLERVREMSGRTGINPAGISLAYLTSAPFPALPIIGSSKPEHIRDSLNFADVTMGEEERQFLACE